MTSYFDDLQAIWYYAIHNPELEDIALRLGELAKQEIESNCPLKYDNWKGKTSAERSYGKFGIFSWFELVHCNVDHTSEYHLKLISPELSDVLESAVKFMSKFVKYKDRHDKSIPSQEG